MLFNSTKVSARLLVALTSIFSLVSMNSYGSGIAETPVATADIVVVIDESGSMSGEQRWVGETIPVLDVGLKAKGIGSELLPNRYGLVGFGSWMYDTRQIDVGNGLMGGAPEFETASDELIAYGSQEDGWDGINTALNTYSFRDAAALNIIFITDEDRDIRNNALTYEGLLSDFQAKNALLNSVVNAIFACPNGKRALGLDANGIGYVYNRQGGYTTCENAYTYRAEGSTEKDYIKLSLATGGAVWDLAYLRAGGGYAAAFTQAILAVKTKEILNQTPVGDLVPVITATPNPASVNQIITLDASASHFSEADGSITDWQWDLDSDGYYETNGANATTRYANAGTYTVKVRISGENDAGHVSSELSFELHVAQGPLPPTASTDGPYIFCEGNAPWTVDGSGSQNPDEGNSEDPNAPDTLTAYLWDLDGDGEFDDANQAVVDVSTFFSGDELGSYPIALRVFDNTELAYPGTGLPNLQDTQVTQLTILANGDERCNPIVPPNRAPSITSQPITSVDENSDYEYAVIAIDEDGDVLTYSLNSTITGMSIDEVTGLIQWNTVADDIGTHTVEITVSDPDGLTASQSFELGVQNVNVAPVITSSPVTLSAENQTYHYKVIASDEDVSDSLTFSLTTAPQSMTIDAATGDINWFADFNSAGQYDVVIEVSDTAGAYAEQGFSLVITNSNQAPVISSNPVTGGTENQLYNYAISASDADGEALNFLLTTSPTGMAISNTGVITWLPGFNAAGSHPVTVQVSDGALDVSQSYNLTIANQNQAPVLASIADQNLVENNELTITLNANDADGDALTYSVTGLPAFASYTNNQITFAPSYDAAGTYGPITVSVTDDIDTDSSTFALTITNNNQPPEITSIPVTIVAEGQSYQYNVVAVDNDGDTITYTLSVAPGGMSINPLSGVIAWEPNFTSSGAELVIVNVTDGLDSVQQSFTLTINNTNQPPVLTAITDQTVVENNAITVSLSAIDADSDALTYSVVGLPNFASLNGAEITIAPGYDDAGNYGLITVTVTDGINSDISTFTINIINNNQIPQITSLPVITIAEGQEYQYPVIATDADGDSLTYSLSVSPANMNISLLPGVITWTPSFNDSGEELVVVEVSDGQQSVQQSFTLTIENTNQVPVIVGEPVSEIGVGENYNYFIIAADPDGGDVSYSLAAAPAWLSIDNESGQFNGMPTGTDVGDDPVEVLVLDSSGGSLLYSYMLSVIAGNNGVPIISGSPVTTAEVDHLYNYQINALDPEGGALTYQLNDGPGTMTVSALGEVSWVPGYQDQGLHDIEIEIMDNVGAVTTHAFPLDVIRTGSSNVGDDFWLMYIGTNSNPFLLEIYITADSPTQGVMEIPRIGLIHEFQVSPGEPEKISLPVEAYTALRDLQNGGKGIHVTTDKVVTVFAANIGRATGDGFLVLPTEQLGTHYLLQSYLDEFSSTGSVGYSNMGVVATEDNTKLQIIPNAVSSAAGVDPVEVILDRGEAYHDHVFADYTGFEVTADKPIAVFSGNPCIRISEASACDAVVEQIPPTNLWGRSFLTAPLATRVGGDTFRVLAAVDGTVVSINGQPVATLSAGEYHQSILVDGATIETTAAVLVSQFSHSASYDTQTSSRPADQTYYADPFMMLVTPTEQLTNHYRVSTPGNFYRVNYINVIVPADAVDTLTMDHQAVIAPVTTILGSDFVSLQIEVIPGEHVFDAKRPFAVYVYGYDHYAGYGYSAASYYKKPTQWSLSSAPDSDTNNFVGNEYCRTTQLSAATNTQDSLLSNQTVQVDISGVNSLSAVVNTDRTGSAKYCYYGSVSGSDTLVFSIEGVEESVSVEWLQIDGGQSTPIIISTPKTITRAGDVYTYQVKAVDADQDAVLTYSYSTYPSISWHRGEIEFDEHTGLMNYTLGTVSPGDLEFTFTVTDETGLTDTQVHKTLYRRNVVVPNHLPVVTSIPDTAFLYGKTWEYDLDATDPDGDSLVYGAMDPYYVGNFDSSNWFDTALLIDSETGIVEWKPRTEKAARRDNYIWVKDGNVSLFHWYRLDVTLPEGENNAPTISIPAHIFQSELNQELSFDVTGNDVDGDSLVYSVNYSASDLSYPNLGPLDNQFRWIPERESDIGLTVIHFRVDDNRGGEAIDSARVWIQREGNTPPVIESLSLEQAYVNQQYDFQFQASDIDGDAPTYTVLTLPAMATLDEVTGVLSLFPSHVDVGEYPIQLEVNDINGGVAHANFTLVISAQSPNQAPVITSVPPALVIEAGTDYIYQIVATDADPADHLSYRKVGGKGLFDDPNGVYFWKPSSFYIGSHEITIEVSDGLLTNTQNFTLEVIAEINHAPVFSNVDWSVSARVSNAVSFDVDATDSNGDSITYKFDGIIPTGMSIDAQTGVVQWLPVATQVGVHPVTVVAEDNESASISQVVTFTVTENEIPKFESAPNHFALSGIVFNDDVDVSDADGDSITYSLAASSPSGMIIDADSGLISWTPSSVGDFEATVYATDGYVSVYRRWNIHVQDSSEPLSVTISANPLHISAGENTSIATQVMGANATAVYTMTLDGVDIPVDSVGHAFVSSDELGAHTVEVSVSDGTETVVAQTIFYVIDPADTEAPTVSLDNPTELQVITAPESIVGSVYDSALESWQLYLQRGHDGNPELLAEGTTSETDAILATIDPTTMINGLYNVTLQATDLSGTVSVEKRNIVIEGDLKVGNFSFSMLDFEIPVEGIPISVTRTYDSRRKQEALDFGYGWSVDYQNVSVDESRVLGEGWARNAYDEGTLISFCIEPLGAPEVSVTLPNGKLERFEVSASPHCNIGVALPDVKFVFTPIGDTQSTLEAVDEFEGRYLNGEIVEAGEFIGALDPQYYKLTTQSGFEYLLDQDVGIQSVKTPNGHTLTYSDDGISHSSGKSIEFIRNPQGRISDIKNPSGDIVMTYVYDTAGDLESSVDSLTAKTRYTYDEHQLLEIFDPLDRKIIKNLYDENGRLNGQENGDGIVKLFAHTITDRTSLVTDLDGRKKLFDYDDNGNVLREIAIIEDGSYASDIVTNYTYDTNNNQETKEVGGEAYIWTAKFDDKNNQLYADDPLDNRVRYEKYNARGQEGEIFDELNRKTVMNYDVVGNLYQIDMPSLTDPDTGEVSNLFAKTVIINGKVKRTDDLRGSITTYNYYPSGHEWAGQKWTESNKDSGTMTYTYDDNNNVKTEVRERTVNSVVVTEMMGYDYDDRNRLVKTTYPDTTYTETEYDLAGNIDKERDRFGVWTDFDYDAYGRLRLTTYVDETTEIRDYSNEGLLTSVIDRMGRETQYEYDDAARLWKTTFHNSAYTNSVYTETKYTLQGWVQFEWDEKRNLTEYEYFLNGRRKAVIRHIGADKVRHEYTYYANGELHTETDPLLRVTTYNINEFDQRISTEFHNGAAVGQRYDAMGARTKQIDQLGRHTRYSYDDLGRLEAVTPEVTINDVAVPDTSYTYDEVGNKLTQTDAEGRTTTWTYDYYGRVLTRTLPELMVESFVYDDAARTVAHTDFNGDTNTTYIDNQGRVDHIDYHDGTSEAYTYWANGQVHTVTDQHGVTETVFDVRDRLDYEIKPDGTRLDYAYDDVGNREQVKVTRGTIITVMDYTFDALNRLDTVTDASGVTSYTYYDNGSLWTVTFPNGVVSEYQYNDVNQLEVLTTKDKDGVVLSSYTYGLDDTGRRDDITEADGRFTDYTYDNLYRLTDEVVTEGGLEVYNANYIYDWVGNRKYETVTDGSTVQTEYDYDLNDRLTSQGGTVYVHDDNGNTLTETLDSVVTEYFYDAKNKMTSVDKGGVVTGYAYDANGIRTSKIEGGVTTQFVVDLNRDYAQVLEEVVGDIETAPASVTYSYGLDLLSQDDGSDFRFFMYDGLGSTRALSDVDGIITDTYDYEAFGELDEASRTGTTDNSYLYAGEQLDEETGNYYLRARYLDPSIGRFTQQDTFSGWDDEPASLHKYLYGNADPVLYTDPTGNFADMGSLMAGIAGGVTLTALAVYTVNNVFSLDRTTADGFDGVLTNKERGIISLLSRAEGNSLWRLAFKDGDESNSVARVEDVLDAQVEDLRARDSSVTISVPFPVRKKRWTTCIARAQSLGRSSGNPTAFGWGWGMNPGFQEAKKAAIRMANRSVQAVDTHHTQWRCIDSSGKQQYSGG